RPGATPASSQASHRPACSPPTTLRRSSPWMPTASATRPRRKKARRRRSTTSFASSAPARTSSTSRGPSCSTRAPSTVTSTTGCPLLNDNYTKEIWEPLIRLVAEGMGVELDDVVEAYQLIHADEDFDVSCAHIAKGTISGMRFEIRGLVDGEPRIVVDHVTKL